MKKSVAYILLFTAGYCISYLQFNVLNRSEENQIRQASLIEQFDTLHKQGGNTGVSQNVPKIDENNNNLALPSVSESIAKLRDLEGISYTDFASLALSPTVEKVEQIIDDMSQIDLEIAINSLTTLTQQEIESIDDTHAFAKKLVGVVLSNSRQEPHEKIALVQFGLDTKSNNQVTQSQDVFDDGTNRIYASFALPVGSQDKVLVKWFRNAPYTLQIMNRYKINPNSHYNYVWFRPKNWESGVYTVEVFAMDSELTLLATGSFEIT